MVWQRCMLFSRKSDEPKKLKIEMNNVNELKSRYNQIYPAFGSYTECMSRTLLTGLSSSVLGTFYSLLCV